MELWLCFGQTDNVIHIHFHFQQNNVICCTLQCCCFVPKQQLIVGCFICSYKSTAISQWIAEQSPRRNPDFGALYKLKGSSSVFCVALLCILNTTVLLFVPLFKCFLCYFLFYKINILRSSFNFVLVRYPYRCFGKNSDVSGSIRISKKSGLVLELLLDFGCFIFASTLRFLISAWLRLQPVYTPYLWYPAELKHYRDTILHRGPIHI